MKVILTLLASLCMVAAADSLSTSNPSIDFDGSSIRLNVVGNAGSYLTILSTTVLAPHPCWDIYTNVLLDVSGKAVVNLPPPGFHHRFFKRLRGGLVYIPAGSFLMGSVGPVTNRGTVFPGEVERDSCEYLHKVTLTKGFWMGQHEVTQGEYLAVTGKNPSFWLNGSLPDPNYSNGGAVSNALSHPVEQVSWTEAYAYCTNLTAIERAAGLIPCGFGYRLPIEAEWEYACRAGTTNAFYFGKEITPTTLVNYDVHEVYNSKSGRSNTQQKNIGRTVPVESYPPNAFGLYGMCGNVAEWCADWYHPEAYLTPDPKDPDNRALDKLLDRTDPPASPRKPGDSKAVVRGGSYNNFGVHCRSAFRNLFPRGEIGSAPNGLAWPEIGFRVVLVPN